MNLFYEYVNELPQFKDYLQLMFNNMRIMVKNSSTGMRVAHVEMAKRELFNPKNKANSKSTTRMLDIVSVGMPQMIYLH